MIISIHKGKHRPAGWWRYFSIWYNKKTIRRKVFFNFSAAYDLQGPDNDDVNKLFGIKYLLFGKNSFRYGWNFNQVSRKVNLYAYTLTNGSFSFVKLCELSMAHWYELRIRVKKSAYLVDVVDMRNGLLLPLSVNSISKTHDQQWSIFSGPWFGGNQPAPHTITIEMKIK